MTTERDWTVRRYREGDDQQILDCLTAAFGRWPGIDIDVPPIDHLRWKMNSHPVARDYHHVVEANGRIVGTRMMIAQQTIVQDRVLFCTNFCDLTIDREYRGRGIMRELWQDSENATREPFSMSIGLTDHPTVVSWMASNGHRQPANTLKQWKCDVSAAPANRRPSALGIVGTASFDARVDDLFAAVASQFDLITVRSPAYLNWRYADPRAGRFAIYLGEAGDQLLGYVVVAVSGDKAFIADLLALPGRTDVIEGLVDRAVAHCIEAGLSSLRTWCVQHHSYREALLAAGLSPARVEESVSFLQWGDTDLRFVFDDDQARLHIVPGDTDIV